MQELTTRGVLNEEMADVLRRAVQARRNVAVVGPLGTGITTLLGALASFSEANERIVTAEDVADLGIQHEHVVSLASGGAHSGVSLRQVMHQAQRLRADRLVIDDVRDESALDALTVLASRGGGGLVGVHAAAGNQPLDALRGLACLGASSPQSVESLLARGVHVIVQVGHADGGRRITRIAEVVQDGRGCETRELFGYNGGFTTGSQASF
jgi:pilus assembly protein CpaF